MIVELGSSNIITESRRVATNSGPGGPGSNWDLFCIASTKAVQKSVTVSS